MAGELFGSAATFFLPHEACRIVGYFGNFWENILNTLNPVVLVFAHADFERGLVGFLPASGGSLDALGVPVVHSLIDGRVTSTEGQNIVSVLNSFATEGYKGADFLLVAWDAGQVRTAVAEVIPGIEEFFWEHGVVEMGSLSSAVVDGDGRLPFALSRPSSTLDMGEAVQDVLALYRETNQYLSAAKTLYSSEKQPEDTPAPFIGSVQASGRLIGVGGRKGHGKDAFAHLLGSDWVIIAMSDPLYDALLRLDPPVEVSGVTMNFSKFLQKHCKGDWVVAKRNPGVRQMLQRLGTDVVRDLIDVDAWVKIMERKVWSSLRSGGKVAVTGIRFPNELRAIERLGGLTVWVERPAHDLAEDTHASETSLKSEDFQVQVSNSGSLEDLQRVASQITEMVAGKES